MTPGERQDAGVLIRLKPGEAEVLRTIAKDAGMTVGVYARRVLRRHIRRARRSP